MNDAMKKDADAHWIRRFGGPQSRKRFDVEENLISLPGIEPRPYSP
jgi:hypothetical protein